MNNQLSKSNIEEYEDTRLGMKVRNFSEEDIESYNHKNGVVVTEVSRGSLAEVVGIANGDLIISINRKPIKNVSEYKKIITGFPKGAIINLMIEREGDTFFMAIEAQLTIRGMITMQKLFYNNFEIKGLTIKNRIMMSPMCMYSADNEGMANDWHFVHYTTRAIGGVGLIMQEATAVEKRGRISACDLGLWDDKQTEPLKKIVNAVHSHNCKIGVQLAHAGRNAK